MLQCSALVQGLPGGRRYQRQRQDRAANGVCCRSQSVPLLMQWNARTCRVGAAVSLSRRQKAQRLHVRAAAPGPTENGDGAAPISKTQARLWLALVPLCWGTYNPILRLLYTQDHAPGPAEFSATRMVFSLVPFAPRLKELITAALGEQQPVAALPAGVPAADGALAVVDLPPPSAREVLLWSAELGSWNFLGTALQAWGLAHTSAVHASLLFASINVFVPVIASITGEKVSPITWVACGLVVYGVGVLNGIDVANIGASDTSALEALADIEPGDVAVLLSSAAYSTYTVRLSRSASRAPALDLAAGKTLTLVFWCFVWAAAEFYFEWDRPMGVGSALWGGEGTSVTTQLIVWAVVFFTAIVPGSLATWLQAKGQSAVSGPEAQLILAVTPVVAVTLAAVFLGEEIAQNAWEGGSVVLGASTLANAVGYFEANKQEAAAAAAASAAAAAKSAAAPGGGGGGGVLPAASAAVGGPAAPGGAPGAAGEQESGRR